MRQLSRRDFVKGATAGTVAAVAGARGRPASAAESLVAVTWGGVWLDGAKGLAQRFAREVRPLDVAWELHQGGAIKILAKIKATWPEVKYDLVAAWDPVWHGMIQEGWLEPLSDLSNLKDVPARFLTKDAQGRPVTAPLNVASVLWGYRTDMVRKPITHFKDLLDPSLKGMIILRTPVSYTALHMLSMALEFGGNERNIEPAFQFLKDLARSGNVGRVAAGDVDTVNSLTTGETAIGFGASGVWQSIAKAHPVTVLARVPTSKGFKGFLYTEGWSVLKGPRASLAKEFANFCLRPENDEYYCATIAAGPTNVKAKPIPQLAQYFYKPEELETFAYFADFPYISSQLDGWVKRFETEIVPLIRRA
jgi:putative spermidine/putrescine transport system substrate-binding protein